MEKVLIIGAGVEQMQAVRIAKELGYHVIVSDMNPNAPAVPLADEFCEVSTTDEVGNLKIASERNINGVLTVCSETAVQTVAYVSEKLHLPGFSTDTARMATNKMYMRKALSQTNVPMAKWNVTDNIKSAIKFMRDTEGPWILKPVDSSGQRGMTKLYSHDNLESAFYHASSFSPNKQVLIDQYLEGPEYHVTMWVQKGEVHFLAISNRITFDTPYFGIAGKHIGPAVLPPSIEDKIKDVCIAAVKGINHLQGVATCELILKNNTPYLLEIAVRVPGGYLREVAQYLSGVDITKATILNSMNNCSSFEDLKEYEPEKAVAVEFITKLNLSESVASIKSLELVIDASNNPNIKLINWHLIPPFNPPNLQSSVGRFGVVITTGNSQKEALQLSQKVLSCISVNKNDNLNVIDKYSRHSQLQLELYH